MTIEDVALAAGVGKVTVSYVLNGRAAESRISDATAARVMETAERLAYRPNANARSLKRRRADAIAVVFQFAEYFSASSSFVAELMSGVCEACVEAGLDVVLHTRKFSDPEQEVSALADGRTDGALVLRDFDDSLLPLLHDARLPVVYFFTRPQRVGAPFVDCDNRLGGEMAAGHLLDYGHRTLGMIAGPAGSTAARERREGFFGRAPETKEFFGKAEEMAGWIREEGITGLFAWSDDVAFDAIRALEAEGLRVPRDLSVIGFDSSSACDRFTPTLTSMRQPVHAMAAEAVRLLTRAIASPDAPPASIIIPPSLDIRASTLPLSAETS